MAYIWSRTRWSTGLVCVEQIVLTGGQLLLLGFTTSSSEGGNNGPKFTKQRILSPNTSPHTLLNSEYPTEYLTKDSTQYPIASSSLYPYSCSLVASRVTWITITFKSFAANVVGRRERHMECNFYFYAPCFFTKWLRLPNHPSQLKALLNSWNMGLASTRALLETGEKSISRFDFSASGRRLA